jgi:hypothetical protein
MPAGQLFSAIVTKALQGLPTLAAFDHNPDMADDTFLLIDRAVRYSPGVVFNPQMLPLIADAAMTGVLVQHRWATQLLCTVTPHHFSQTDKSPFSVVMAKAWVL